MHKTLLFVALLAALVASNEILFWNEVALSTYVRNTNYFPTPLRNHPIFHTAIHRAVKAMGCWRPFVDCNTARANLTIAHAAAFILKSTYPNDQHFFDVIMKDYYETYTDELDQHLAKTIGEGVARLTFIERAADNLGAFDYAVFPDYDAPNQMSDYPIRTCPLNQLLGLDDLKTYNQWQNVDTYYVPSEDFFNVPPPPAADSEVFIQDYNRTFYYGFVNSTLRTADETEIAIFHDAGFGSETASGTISRVVAELVKQTNTGVYDTSVIMSLTLQAVHDTFVQILFWKGYYETERPWSMCSLGLPANPDLPFLPGWTPLIPNPCGGEYPAGHATASGVAYRILELLFGTGDFTFTVESSQTNPPVSPRTWTSLRAYSDEANNARTLAGLHFDFSNIQGQTLGIETAEYIYQRACRNGRCLVGK